MLYLTYPQPYGSELSGDVKCGFWSSRFRAGNLEFVGVVTDITDQRRARKHSGQMKRVFSELNAEELRGLEVTLKKVGKRAAALMEES